MIITDFYTTREDGVKLFATYSDRGLLIEQVETGRVYAKAIDVENAPYTYREIEQEAPSDLY